MSATRELLLGYLLNALDPREQVEVEQALTQQPRLREELDRLRASLTPLGFPARCDDEDLDGPPLGLASRTCAFIEEMQFELTAPVTPASSAVEPVKLSPSSPSELHPVRRRLTWPDLIVAASVLLAAGSLLFPAIATSRQQAQITQCQNNLRELGIALQQYANYAPDHRIPAVPARGKRAVAGIYAPLLAESQLLPQSRLLVCPSSDTPEMNPRESLHIPTLAEIDAAVGHTLTQLQRSLGGSYGYNLGFLENDRLRAPRMEGRSAYPLMSDAPSNFSALRLTRNHAGRGQNILYEDNHVSYVTNLAEQLIDDPYRNRSGIVAAGEDDGDVVLGESNARPMPQIFLPRPE